MFRNSTLSVYKILGLICGLLLACGTAGAQKKKMSDPYASMPPLPAPRLLNMASAPAPEPGLANSAAATPPASSTSATGEAASATAVPSEMATGGPSPSLINPAAAFAPGASTAASTPAPAAPPASTSPAAPATPAEPYSAMAPSTGLISHSILSLDDYAHLLDLVLPMDHRSPPGLEYSLVLRFEPHIHPESEIVIRHWRGGKTETALYRVQDANAWRAAYGNVVEGQTPDFVSMVKQIKVLRNSFQLSTTDATALYNKLLPDLQKDVAKERKKAKHSKKEDNFEIERGGTRYELWFIKGDNEMHFTSFDSEVDTMTKGNLDLTRWMNEVRSYAESHLADYKPLSYAADDILPQRQKLSKNKKQN